MSVWHHHPAVRAGDQLSRGERAADRVSRTVGSWRFIGWQTVVVLAWIAVNVVGVFGLRWDPYPFIALNLVFSTQAAYAAPILQLASNRDTDRMADLVTDLHRMAECMHRSPATGECSCGQ